MSVFRDDEPLSDTSRQGQVQESGSQLFTGKDQEEAEYEDLFKKKRAAEQNE